MSEDKDKRIAELEAMVAQLRGDIEFARQKADVDLHEATTKVEHLEQENQRLREIRGSR